MTVSLGLPIAGCVSSVDLEARTVSTKKSCMVEKT